MPRADCTVLQLRFLITNQQFGRKNRHRDCSRLGGSARGGTECKATRGLSLARRHTATMMPIPMLKTKLKSTRSKTGMSSHLFTQPQRTIRSGSFNGKFSYEAPQLGLCQRAATDCVSQARYRGLPALKGSTINSGTS